MRLVLALLTLASAVVLGLCMNFDTPEMLTPQVTAPVAAGPPRSPQRSAEPPRRLEGARFALATTAEVRLGSHPVEYALDGELEVHALGGDPERLAARIVGGILRLDVGEDSHALTLDDEWWAIEFGPDGAAEALRTDVREPLEWGLLAAVAAEWLWARHHPHATRWTRLDRDTNGRYPASYRRLDDGRIERRRAPYVELGEGFSEGAGVDIEVAGTTLMTPGEAPWPAALDSRITITLGRRAIVPGEGEQRLRLDYLGAVEPEPGLDAHVARLPRRALDAQAPAGAVDPAARLVAGMTLEQVLDGCISAVAGEGDLGEAISRLRAWVTAHPGDIDVVLAAIAETQDPATMDALVGALGSSPAPEAELGLMTLAADAALPTTTRNRAILELGLRDEPHPDVLDALGSLADTAEPDVVASARLATGSTARALADTDPVAAAAAIDDLVSDLHEADDPIEREILLRALGNAGSDAALPVVEGILAEADPALRQAALHALRNAPPGRADAVLAEHLADPDPQTRRDAAAALAGRESGLAALGSALSDEQDTRVRSALVRAVARSLPDPNAARMLADAATTEHDPQLRALAAALAERAHH